MLECGDCDLGIQERNALLLSILKLSRQKIDDIVKNEGGGGGQPWMVSRIGLAWHPSWGAGDETDQLPATLEQPGAESHGSNTATQVVPPAGIKLFPLPGHQNHHELCRELQ